MSRAKQIEATGVAVASLGALSLASSVGFWGFAIWATAPDMEDNLGMSGLLALIVGIALIVAGSLALGLANDLQAAERRRAIEEDRRERDRLASEREADRWALQRDRELEFRKADLHAKLLSQVKWQAESTTVETGMVVDPDVPNG